MFNNFPNGEPDMSNFLRKLGLSMAALLATALTGTALGAPTTFNVTANVPAICKINSAGNMGFGAYDVTSPTSIQANSTISVTCSKGTVATVALSAGGGSFVTRTMADVSANTLSYNLFKTSVTNATCTGGTVFGDGTGSTQTEAGTSASVGTPLTFTVFGCIPAGQDATAGSSENYTDTITVTVTFT